MRAGRARSLRPGVQGPEVRADRAGARAGSSSSEQFEATKVTATPGRRTHAAALGRVRPAALLRPRRGRPRRHPRRQAAAAGAQARRHGRAAVPRRHHRQRERHAGPRRATPGRSSYSTPARSGRPASCSPPWAASPRRSSTRVPRHSSPACGRCTSSRRASSWRSCTRSCSPARPMGVASARAREEARKAGDATWLAFVVYARPDAVLVTHLTHRHPPHQRKDPP